MFYFHEHCKVERVEGDFAIVTVSVPLKDLDSVTALVDHIFNGARWLRMRSRMSQAVAAARSARGLNGVHK